MKAMGSKVRIKQSAMELLNDITVDVMKTIARQAADLCEHGKSKVLNAKTLEAAVKMTIPGEMAQYAIEQAQEAVLKYQQYEAPSSSSAWSINTSAVFAPKIIIKILFNFILCSKPTA